VEAKAPTATDAPTHLYRHFDAEGNLLYVGISLSAVARLEEHKAQSKEWFNSIAKVTIERFPTRKLALKAELRAINEENPRYNVVGNKDLKKRSLRRKLLLAMPVDMAQQITNFRFIQRIPSESAAMRRLIMLGLNAVSQQPQREV